MLVNLTLDFYFWQDLLPLISSQKRQQRKKERKSERERERERLSEKSTRVRVS